MTDPIQASQMAIQGAQGLEQGLEGPAQVDGAEGTQEPSFEEVMEGQQAGASQAPAAPEAPAQVAPAESIDASARLDEFVRGVFEDESRIEEMMQRCVGGQTLGQGELLQLQSLIYGYAQKVELASKVVDKATGGLKQIMNTQV